MWILAQQFSRPDPTVIPLLAYVLCVGAVLLPVVLWLWRAIGRRVPLGYGTPLFFASMNLMLIGLAAGGPLPEEVSRLDRAAPLLGSLAFTLVTMSVVRIRSAASQ